MYIRTNAENIADLDTNQAAATKTGNSRRPIAAASNAPAVAGRRSFSAQNAPRVATSQSWRSRLPPVQPYWAG